MGSTSFRGLTRSERTLLDAFLAHDFPGVDDLRREVPEARVRSGCPCGCGTLEFDIDRQDGPPDSGVVEHPVEFEGVVLNEHGSPIGGLLLFVKKGHLSSLEVYSYSEGPLPLPDPDRVEWVSAPRS